MERVRAEDRLFYFSKVVKVVTEFGDRFFAVALVPDRSGDKPVLKRRLFYKSDSGGNWRYTPYLLGAHFSKGLGRHYTAETQPVREISFFLDSKDLAQAELVSDQKIWAAFDVMQMESASAERALRTFGLTVDFAEAPDLFQVQQYQPGKVFKWNNGQLPTAADFTALQLPEGFVPDFRQEPGEVSYYDHSLLGRTKLSTFSGGKLAVKENGISRERPVLWTLAEDGAGRVWIQSIRFADARVNSHGTYDSVIDSGVLTSKPLEYYSQVGGLDRRFYKPFDGKYADISPMLANLAPIQAYLAARGRGPLKK